MSNNSQDKKQDFRKKALKKLQNINNSYLLSKKINKKLIKIIDIIDRQAKLQNILFYAPLWFEPNILPIVKIYKKRYKCFMPYIEKASFKAIPFRYPLRKSAFNTQESNNSIFYKKNIDLMIVPILGYDIECRRIGFGKGMYDRFFSTLKKKPIVVFVQLREVFAREVITQDFDIKFDIYISSTNIKQFHLHKFALPMAIS